MEHTSGFSSFAINVELDFDTCNLYYTHTHTHTHIGPKWFVAKRIRNNLWKSLICYNSISTKKKTIFTLSLQSSGKVVYFTALFPYVVLTIFFVRGLTLKGAGAGLAHMFYPKMESLLQPTVWLNAAVQVTTNFNNIGCICWSFAEKFVGK